MGDNWDFWPPVGRLLWMSVGISKEISDGRQDAGERSRRGEKVLSPAVGRR
jgi:hypothetical protein